MKPSPRFERAVLLGICSFAAPCATAVEDKTIFLEIDPRPSVIVFKLSPAELEHHSRAALGGSIPSSHCVAMHYNFVATDDPDGEYWLTIAAENGDNDSMELLSLSLAGSKHRRDKERAVFWGERASKTPNQKETSCRLKSPAE